MPKKSLTHDADRPYIKSRPEKCAITRTGRPKFQRFNLHVLIEFERGVYQVRRCWIFYELVDSRW